MNFNKCYKIFNMAWISRKDRQPSKVGNYRIKNNAPTCNNGEGECEWLGNEWNIPDMIKSFCVILYWWE